MKKILIVDDSWMARNMIEKSLSSIYEIFFAENGIEALEKIAALEPDLILLDLLMPEMDGLAVLKELKKSKFPGPIIIISADIQESTRSLVLSLGAAAFVNKPPKREVLQVIIAGILEGV